jgi:hypothetical protein
MKRIRDVIENYTRSNGVKKIVTGKLIYRCTHCAFVACTEGNIESHVKSKHNSNENKNDNVMKN